MAYQHLTKEDRDALPDDDFAVPGKRALPIQDGHHLKLAWGSVQSAKGLSASDRAEARRRIIERASKLDIDPKSWERKTVPAGSMVANKVEFIFAQSLNIDNDNHPNKMPFTGILTRIDEPSDGAPEGSNGKRVMITYEAASRALDSLLGMAVDYVPDWSGHEPTTKIGLITSATIDGNAIRIAGFIYAADFPDVAAEIKANKENLGFSFEARDLLTTAPDADPIPIVDCVFTGAAILLKDKAAYTSTEISASREFIVDENGIADLLAASLKPLADAVAAHGVTIDELKTMPGKIQAGFYAANTDRDESNSTVEAALAKVTASFETKFAAMQAASEAAQKIVTDELAATKTKLADMQAAATRATPAPERRTWSRSTMQLLAKASVRVPTNGDKLEIYALDEALGKTSLTPQQRMQVKTALHHAGKLD